jgi:RNA polymerase sigma factor (sigma-70 family)
VADPRVYIVDDDSDVRDSLVWLLKSVGIAADAYPGPEDFLAALDPETPGCLIVDVRMPRVSGFQLQERLNRLGVPLPVVFCSAHGDIRMSVRALQQGAVDFIEKPYDPQQMIEVVQTNLLRATERFAQRDRRRQVEQRLQNLTPRELEILRLVIDGLPSQNIARQLGTSVKTVDVHRARIKNKTEADSIATLVRDILQNGVTV